MDKYLTLLKIYSTFKPVKKRTPPFLLEQALDYVNSIPYAELEYANVVDADTIRIWYRNTITKNLSCALRSWIKPGAVTIPLKPLSEISKSITSLDGDGKPYSQFPAKKYVPGDYLNKPLNLYSKEEKMPEMKDGILVKEKQTMEI